MAEMKDFPANSNKKKTNAPAKAENKPEVEKVVKGEVVKKKIPIGKKFSMVFLGGELKSAGRFIATDVLLPALRNLIVEMTEKGIEKVVFGDNRPTPRSGMGSTSRISYNRPTERYGPRREVNIGHQSSRPRTQEIADIYLETLEDAEIVVERLSDRIEQYDFVTVAELYKMCGIPHNHVDTNWGWSDLRRVTIRQTRQGYTLDMPRIEEA